MALMKLQQLQENLKFSVDPEKWFSEILIEVRNRITKAGKSFSPKFLLKDGAQIKIEKYKSDLIHSIEIVPYLFNNSILGKNTNFWFSQIEITFMKSINSFYVKVKFENEQLEQFIKNDDKSKSLLPEIKNAGFLEWEFRGPNKKTLEKLDKIVFKDPVENGELILEYISYLMNDQIYKIFEKQEKYLSKYDQEQTTIKKVLDMEHLTFGLSLIKTRL